MTVTVHFILEDGKKTVSVAAAEGERLLDAAQEAGIPLEGTCGGAMSCSTCHVIADGAWLRALPAASIEEEELLDLTPYQTPASRLACQIVLTRALDGLTLKIPPQN